MRTLIRFMNPCVALVMAALVTGCAGLAMPISRTVPASTATEDVEHYRRWYDNPRDLAIYRVAQWNAAIANLERANGASIIGQSGIAGAVTYRSARNLSHPATALLAAAGLYGNSLSDAFVQVSRINVYLAGVEGMECAIAAYGTLPDPYDSDESRKDIALLSSEGAELAREIRNSHARSKLALNGAMVLAVSRISRKVDAALMGSLVTAQSQGASWTSAYSSAEQGRPKPSQASMFVSKTTDSAETIQARSRLQGLLANSLALESEVTARKAQIDACDITAPSARIDRSAQPLGIDHLGESDPINIKPGTQVSVRLYGGLPPYTPKVLEPNTAKIVVTIGDGGYATIVVPDGAAAGDYQIAFTESTPGNPAKILKVAVVP
jgi:hypothetical protein